MEEFFEKRNVEVTAFLREMAEYFVQFSPGPDNLYRKLIDALRGYKAVFSTTNYDLLIELCVKQAGRLVSYAGFPLPENNIPVLKIHGSCNFLPDVLGRFKNVGFKIRAGGAILSAPIRPASPQEVEKFCRTEDSIAPAISMYARGKAVLFCPEFIKHQQQEWEKEIHISRRIFVIGLRVNEEDTHIWGTLARAKVPIGYVGREPEEFESWAKKNKRKKICVVSDSFEDAIGRIAKNIKIK
jgi:hypothetical protein